MIATTVDPTLRTIRASGSVPAVVVRVEGALAAAGIRIFAKIDHAAEARAAGLSMRATVLLLVGKPEGGTPLMIAQPTVAIDLPLKGLIWEDAEGAAWLTYNTPLLLTQRHGIPRSLAARLASVGELLERVAGAG